MKKALAFLMAIVFSMFFISCGEIEMTATPIELKGKVTNKNELINYLDSIENEGMRLYSDTGYEITLIVNEEVVGIQQIVNSSYNFSGRIDYSAIPFYTASSMKLTGSKVTDKNLNKETVTTNADLIFYQGRYYFSGQKSTTLSDNQQSPTTESFKSLVCPDLLKYTDSDYIFSLLSAQNYMDILELVEGGTLYSSDRGFMGKKLEQDKEAMVYCKLEKGNLQYDEISIYLKTVERKQSSTTTKKIRIDVTSTSYSSDYKCPVNHYDYTNTEVEL